MEYTRKHKIDINDKTTQAACETYITLKKEGKQLDPYNIFQRLKKKEIIVRDEDYLQAIIDYLELLQVNDISSYKYYLHDIPQSAYDWKRQKMVPKEFQVFLCKLSNLAFHFARKNIVPDISNKFILNWRYQYESFTGYKLNKDKIGYMIKILNKAKLTDIRKNKQQVNGKWSTLHTVVLGQKHPLYHYPTLKFDEIAEIQRKSRAGLITDYNGNKPKKEMWYSYWLKNRVFIA